MENMIEKTKNYLREIQRDPISLKVKTFSELPLLLRERYKLYISKLFGREWLLAVETEGWEPGSPTEYRQHLDQISRATGKDYVVLVLPTTSAKVRNRLVRMEIPFIVPNTQIFLPLAMISLREKFGIPYSAQGKPLSPVAQVLLLLQLQQGGIENMAAKDISIRAGYSRASISTACSELEQNHLCRTYREGKELRIKFEHSSRDLWDKALPLLKSPVRSTHWVVWIQQVVPEARLAGISALAELSSLADDRIPTYAMSKQTIQKYLETGRIHGCADQCDTDAKLEAWSYAPSLISEGSTVDRLSLYLALRYDPDERVQAALSGIMEDFPWR